MRMFNYVLKNIESTKFNYPEWNEETVFYNAIEFSCQSLFHSDDWILFQVQMQIKIIFYRYKRRITSKIFTFFHFFYRKTFDLFI